MAAAYRLSTSGCNSFERISSGPSQSRVWHLQLPDIHAGRALPSSSAAAADGRGAVAAPGGRAARRRREVVAGAAGEAG